MITVIARFLFGEIRYRLKLAPYKGANLFLYSGIPCFKGKVRGDNSYEISVERGDKPAIERLFRSKNIDFEILYERGLFPFLAKCACRPGLALGLAAALFIIWQSTNYVWEIHISGNEQLSDRQVKEILEEYGFFIGCRHSAIDLHSFCNELPMGREDIAWISVNMMGSVAEVQIIENKAPPEKQPAKTGLVNLVASTEGQIVRYELSSGKAMADVGQVVKKGQLLVAGFSEKEGALHPTVSSGKVFARVWNSNQVFIPYTATRKIEKKQVILEKKIFFLGKEIIFFKNSRFSEPKYDILEDEYRPTVFGIALPLPITVSYALPYTEEEYTIDKKEAEELAKKQLIEKLRGVSNELLESNFSVEEEEKGVRVTLKALCIADIAKAVKVTIEED